MHRSSSRAAAGPASAARPRAVAGFTLAELLMAATLGALLLLATANSAGVFGRQLEALAMESDASKQSALAGLSDEVRYAWLASVPSRSELELYDSTGAKTLYQFRGTQLVVTRSNGSQGTVLDNLKSVSFTADTSTRYREAAPASRAGTFWTAATPATAVQSTVLDPGDKIALGFTPASPAPIGGNPTAGVQEQMLNSTLDGLRMVVATVDPITAGATLKVSLYRARSPLDARPDGAALGSISLTTASLPKAASTVVNTKNGKTIATPKKPTWGWWDSKANAQLVVTPPSTPVSLDVSTLSQKVRPGYAYTLVLEPTGSGVALATYTAASATNSGVARSLAGAAYAGQALVVPRDASGIVSLTRTTGTTVTRRVLVKITDLLGNDLTGSATVVGQGLADNAWLGVVPGEIAK